MPGKNYIRVSSIILMILGVINIFLYLIAAVLLGSAAIGSGSYQSGGMLTVLAVAAVILSIFQFIAAFQGLKNCERKEAAGRLKKWGIALIVLDVVVGIMGAVSAVSGGQSVLSSLSSTITGMLFPLLYTYGAYLNETRG